ARSAVVVRRNPSSAKARAIFGSSSALSSCERLGRGVAVPRGSCERTLTFGTSGGQAEPDPRPAGTLPPDMASLPSELRRDPERLLAHDRFVRGLARCLVRDAHAAEDLAQEAWVAALQVSPPPLSWHGWLATVVRRIAGKDARGRRREE